MKKTSLKIKQAVESAINERLKTKVKCVIKTFINEKRRKASNNNEIVTGREVLLKRGLIDI